MIDPVTFLPPSVSREALIIDFKLPANTTEEGVDAEIQRRLCAKYGLPITATNEEIGQRMHEVRCRKFKLDPTTTSEAELDLHVAGLIEASKRAA
jgi:hypothetical protein